ncbi:MAG: MBL fold metallo-hydrolase [Erysipelotrichaceae bacterium]|nr:MBL fold metallo-hydrolase [Erysipelotrichaceae bacterium]
MKLTVLVDNNTYIDQYYLAEPALCYLIEDNREMILFDVGYSEVLITNALRMGINLKPVNHIVLSHGHIDHTGGLLHIAFLTQPITIIAHPEADHNKVFENTQVGSPITFDKLPDNFQTNFSKQPIKITSHFTYLGEIPRLYPFEGQPLENDDLADDTALIYHHDDTLWVITGCSHSGICNICEYAKKISGINHINGIIGGFHLLNNLEKTYQTCEYFKEHPVDIIYPAHCTDLAAKIELSKIAKIKEVGVGLVIDIK